MNKLFFNKKKDICVKENFIYDIVDITLLGTGSLAAIASYLIKNYEIELIATAVIIAIIRLVRISFLKKSQKIE